MRWNENETYEFVKLYMSYECLWNTDHEHYKLNKKRLNAYKDISTKFNESTGMLLSLSDIKCKIKNLRSTYSQELAKIRVRSGSDFMYRPTLKWFSHWHRRFQRLGTHRATDSSSTVEESEELDDSGQKIWMPDGSDNLNEETHIDPFIDNNDYSLFLKCEPEEPKLMNGNSSRKIKRKKIKHWNNSVDISESNRDSTDSSVTLREDEFDIYGKYIASQLRNMDLSKALRLQLEIQNLVSRARLSDLS